MHKFAIIADFPEEQWPSMDLCAEMLAAHLPGAVRLEAPFRRGFGWLPGVGRRRIAFNADRFLNRYFQYPRFLKRHVDRFDFFHVVDHSYAHLVHVLPPGRAGVFCHDLDAFRCLIEPQRDRRPRWFRALARRILGGLLRAAVVFHSTEAVRAEILRHGLLDPSRLLHVPYGVSSEFVPDANGSQLPSVPTPYLLHVSGNVPRKRIDVLLDAFAAVRKRRPDVHLVRVGGPFTRGQQQQIERLGLGGAITRLENLQRRQLAGLYRGAALLLLPSDAEGFGLPVIEALACGAPVLASDLPVLREIGGDAVIYRPVGDVPEWADAIVRCLDGSAAWPGREARRAQAARFTWGAHASAIRAAYMRLI